MSNARFGLRTRDGLTKEITEGLSVIDADATSFITSANITNSTQITAIIQLVTDLKNYGIWSKIVAMYPFVGGTSTSHMYNLKDSRNSNDAFRLSFNGGWTHSNNGVQGNGINAYAETYYILGYNYTTSVSTGGVSAGIYCRTNSQFNGVSFGSCDINFAGVTLALKWTSPDNNTYWGVGSLQQASTTLVTDTRGLFTINRFSDTQIKFYTNGALSFAGPPSVVNVAQASPVPWFVSIWLGARNQPRNSPIVQWYDNREYALFYIAKTMTDSEVANLYNAIQTFQTTLGRQV